MSDIGNKTVITNLSVYSITHALIDAACAAVISAIICTNRVEAAYFLSLIVLYNVLAFALQAPFGFIIDKLRIPVHSSVIGCLLTAVAALLIGLPFAAVCFAGIGNALFHVGGGIICLNLIPKKAAIPGIYVAPGALGLFIGILIGKSGHFLAWPFVFLLLIACFFIIQIKPPEIDYSTERKGRFNYFELIILLLLISITVRSFVGLMLVFPWKSNILLLLILTAGVVLGKGFGGILADRFGWIRISILGLLISAPLLSFGSIYPYLAITGVFLFNLTMPVTLTAIANVLPGRSGFAFGLTTLALIIGAFPAFTASRFSLNNQWIIFSIILISAVILFTGLRLYYNKPISKISIKNSEGLKR